MKRSAVIPVLFLLLAASGLRAATEQVDVVVYSGVPCGVAASIMAARQGGKVILIEPNKHVGGLSTSGLLHFLTNEEGQVVDFKT